jgi:hypothetical protein
MFDAIVCDEATKLASNRSYIVISNEGKQHLSFHGGHQAQMIAQLAVVTKYFIEATGTPCTDSLTKIWGQAWYCDGGAALGRTYSAFEQQYFSVNKRNPYKLLGRENAVDAIARAIVPFTYTIMAKDWLDIEKIREVEVPIKLSSSVMKLYKKFESDSMIELKELKGSLSRFDFLTAALGKVEKLLQISSGFIIPQDEDGKSLGSKNAKSIHEEKLEALADLIEEIDRPVIVAYYYKASYERLRRKFNIRFVTDKDRLAVDDWNKGKIPILGLHWQAGHGLNLQHGGCDIIMYDLRWSGDQYTQLINRIGPARQKASGYNRVVTAYSLICTGTQEARVNDVLHNKCNDERAFLTLIKELIDEND